MRLCGIARCWLVALGIVTAVTGMAPHARAADAPPPALKHGVNLSNWFADTQRQPLVAHDFEAIKAAGFDHVRIPINPESLGFSLYDAESGRVLFDFSGLDGAVSLARDKGLSVILDIQPSDSFMNAIETDAHAEAGLTALWQHIADHYKPYSTSTIAYELLNEPRYKTAGSQYRTMIGDIVAAVRQEAPKNVIIVDLPKGATLGGFDDFVQLVDDNVQYAFHFYEPYIITHQGMKAPPVWGRSLRYFRNLPYPSGSADVNGNYFPDAADTQEAKRMLADYVTANWDAGHIAARVKIAADWAVANHRHVICTEFGAARRFTDPVSRYRWIADTRKALETAGIGWSLWDYADLFGIVRLTGDTVTESGDGLVHLANPDEGSRDVEPDAVKALFGG